MNFKKIICAIFESLKRKNPTKFKEKDGYCQYYWTIYGYKDFKEAWEKFNFVHYKLKYKVIIPLLWLFKLILGKKLDREIPEGDHYKNIVLFDEAYEETIIHWIKTYVVNPKSPTYDIMVERFLEKNKNNTVEIMRIMKKILLFVVTQDTAYFEFMNILMHKISHKMFEEYKGQTHYHLYYRSNKIYDVSYLRSREELNKKK